MTKAHKRKLIRDLCKSITKVILANVDRMPEEWDGHELRRYIADKFEEQTGGLLARGRVRMEGQSRRMKEYRNTVIVKNL